MGEQNLCHLPPDETLVATVSQLLDSGGVPNVLWGNYLLTVYGIPSLTNCVVVAVRSRPPPISHFHLNTKDVHIYLYPQSQVLPNISDLKKAEGQIVSASDPSLPRSRMGYGKGAFASEFNCVRVPFRHLLR
ncbi:hypothetical protein AJ80_02209 [Polytolypa hystricis UAMH7299]|uniref:Uncharacterized protein n=1 Tax=Polytolypa hystricis (strain UAMH7299) TaxID=1447883 RepID=A0A2B7YRV6_POLH7|nr:hypothetical protein AJ80_02209 [Polytolypa hystricis UAMH7299]